MSSRRVEIDDNRIVFNNLVSSGEVLGETRVIEAKVPSQVTHSNAKGCLREVENLQAVCDIADEAAVRFKKRFVG